MRANSATTSEEWEKAQQRLCLYLRLMKVPPLESLEMALQALKLARRTPSEGTPLRKSMDALRRLLSDWIRNRGEDPESAVTHSAGHVPLPAPLVSADFGGIRSRPPLNRGFMLPEDVR